MTATLTQRWAAHLVGALVAGGVRRAVICPGSRSTPLALALAEQPSLRHTVVLDERTAGFFALGQAKAAREPVALVCTSGSAGAHVLPAVMEAAHGGHPLVVLTADRPWELQGFGAAQTTEQRGLFADFVRAREALPAPEDRADVLAHLVAVTARAVAAACGRTPGPVHLNVPFREPLEPESMAPGPVLEVQPATVQRGRTVPDVASLRAALEGARRPLVVCGPRLPDGQAQGLHALAGQLGAPVVAEAASNLRFGFPEAIALADVLLRSPRFAEQARPDVVLRFGGGLTSKVLQKWLEATPCRAFVFPERAPLVDPSHRAEAILEGEAAEVCVALGDVRSSASGYREAWLSAQTRAAEALASEADALDEPAVARTLVSALPDGANLVLSSSMPIRDADAFGVRPAGPLAVHSNRGLNGIDGVTSTALGIASAAGAPTALLTGDLAFLHDLGGLVLAKSSRVPLVVVVVNNDGGGIFSFLPIAERTTRFEALFGTPQGVDLAHAAALAGATLHRPEDVAGLRRAVVSGCEGGLHVIEVRTRRDENVARHRALQARMIAAVEAGA